VIDQGTPTELIYRTIGKDVVEIEGVEAAAVRQLANQAETWIRSFGSGYILALPDTDSPGLWEQLTALNPTRLTRRRANLEDVFLRLTGSVLS